MATLGPAEPLIPAQILHVDDDQESLDQAREYLQGEDIGGWGEPNVESLQTFADALALLEARRFDLVILDVRLGGYEPQDTLPEEEQGVRTLEEIRQRRFVPVVFWTGLPERARHLEDPLVRVHDKTDGLQVLLGAVRELFHTRLPAVNRALLRLIEEEQRSYMWDFVARHWAELSEGDDPMELAYLLARRLGRSLDWARNRAARRRARWSWARTAGTGDGPQRGDVHRPPRRRNEAGSRRPLPREPWPGHGAVVVAGHALMRHRMGQGGGRRARRL